LMQVATHAATPIAAMAAMITILSHTQKPCTFLLPAPAAACAKDISSAGA